VFCKIFLQYSVDERWRKEKKKKVFSEYIIYSISISRYISEHMIRKRGAMILTLNMTDLGEKTELFRGTIYQGTAELS
jgi:hypothetical protein